jgi:hypothetical protein
MIMSSTACSVFPTSKPPRRLQYIVTFARPRQIPKFRVRNLSNSKLAKLIDRSGWWAHKISYPWLLPSLNRSLTQMSHLHWDLTPGDTNPIEGSHVQDNQVNRTNLTILEAVLSYSIFDFNIHTADLIQGPVPTTRKLRT